MTEAPSNTNFRIFLILLGVLGLLLVATTIRGAFIIDEMNYAVNVIGLRQGRLTVPGTGGLTPSNELLYFDPEPYDRVVTSTPVYSIAPPLYAPIALPFSVLGWIGLAFLNTLSFILCALLVFVFVKRRATETTSPWLAVGLFVLGGYSLEYSQGVWPHMLSVFLVVAALYCVGLTWDETNPLFAFLGGIFIGLACGVREQNIFLMGCLGLTVILWGKRRASTTSLYAAGAALPLLASATLNYFRLGVFYPTPKALAYGQFVSKPVESGVWQKPFEVFLVKIVDFSSFVWFRNPAEFVDYARESSTGAYLVGGIVKQALLQSSPWIALAIVVGIAVWLRPHLQHIQLKRQIRALSLLLLLPLAMFSMAGFRMDGLCFNQRYLLEIVPVAAIIVAVYLDGFSLSPTHLVFGFLSSCLAFAVLLVGASSGIQHVAMLRVPIGLGILLVLASFYGKRFSGKRVLGIILGLSIGWAFMVQTVDLAASRRIRETNAVGLDSLDAVIPDHSALFTFWGAQKSTAGPMQLHKNIVILDAWADMGKEAPTLARELLHQQRRVFLYGTGMPTKIINDIRGQDSLRVVLSQPFVVYELIDQRAAAHPVALQSSKSQS